MTAIFAVTLIATLLLAPAAPPEQSSSPALSKPGCTDEVVAFSSCLDYVSAAPNNVTDMPSSHCCEAFFKAFNSGDGNCFCYIVRQPLIFGFPLNESRLVSLPTICDSANSSFMTMNNGSLQSICAAADNGPSTSESAATSTNAEQPPTKPISRSSTVKHISNSYWFLAIFLFLVITDNFSFYEGPRHDCHGIST